MKPSNIIVLVAVVVALISVLYSFMGSQDQSAYIEQINKEREEKDRFMRTSGDSPFASDPKKFTKLNYYPPDPKYKINASLKLIQTKKPVVLGTNDGGEQHYLEYAYAEFDLDGYHHRLLILENMDAGSSKGKLFLAFGDETSAGETYGAGRYLDVAKADGNNSLDLDFNVAYNPYCAYVDKYSCPFPPAENLLKVPIRAGEKVYDH
ncbi:MAG TPA: DUF1684 domain-containing protein [Chryseolinea sp.]|nr:DUF1684 domain-containing protein [Chryseolinea sp.]